MTPKRFVSKVDAWLPGVFVAVVLIQIAALAGAAAQAEDAPSILVGAAVLLLTTALFIWFLRGTYYDVSGDTLRIVCGPFRQRIMVRDITAIEPTRSMLSSPALSLDRLRIRHGKNRRVLVSPADKRGFIRALGFDEEGLLG
jgi:hypothetical protein